MKENASGLANDAPDFDNELENLCFERDRTITFLAEVQISLAEEIQNLAEARRVLGIKDTYIASLLEEHQKLGELIKEKNRYIQSLTGNLADLKAAIEVKDSYIKSLVESITELKAAIEVKDTYTRSLQVERGKLEDYLAQIRREENRESSKN